MNRSNSFVNSLKWWPLQNHNNSTNQSNAGDKGGGGGAGGSGGNGFRNFMTFHKNQSSSSVAPHHHHQAFGSSVAVQKLRESKWFKFDEQRIFCAVVECGFIVELRSSAAVAHKLEMQQQKRQRLQSLTNKLSSSPAAQQHVNASIPITTGYDSDDLLLYKNQNNLSGVLDYAVDNDEDEEEEDDLDMQDENETPITTWFGIVLCKTTKENKPKPETIEIFSVKIRGNGTFRMMKMSLEDIWNNGWELRINNFADKEKSAHIEKDIRSQISFARKAKQSLWNNNKHFVYWCRYGSRQQDVRKRQMSECVKWGSVGMNAGMLLLMNKQKSYSSSK